jgi:hypothetical protein
MVCGPLATLNVQLKPSDCTPRSLQPFCRGVGERDGLVVELVGQVRGEHGNRQGNGRLNFHAKFLGIAVGSAQAVDLGRPGVTSYFSFTIRRQWNSGWMQLSTQLQL